MEKPDPKDERIKELEREIAELKAKLDRANDPTWPKQKFGP